MEPFSHRPGVRMVLPGSVLEVEIYPTRLIWRDRSTSVESEIERVEIPVSGLVDQFTAQLDLERGKIWVWGNGECGYFRYAIIATGAKSYRIEKGGDGSSSILSEERLSLGCHRQLDWDLVMRRLDLAEILPIWLRLGQVVPTDGRSIGPSLLSAAAGQRDLAPWLTLLKSSFTGILAPCLQEANVWGAGLSPLGADWSGGSLPLLSQGAELIRALFIQEGGGELALLPLLPIAFHCGRYLRAKTSFGSIDFEWSKKRLRRVILRAQTSGELLLRLQPDLSAFRLRSHPNDPGKLHPVERPVTLAVEQQLYLDRFST
jgi:hypothetical protein